MQSLRDFKRSQIAEIPTNLANGFPSDFLKGHPFIKSGNYYHISAYFVDPAIICFCGRSATLFQQQGVGTDLYIQNGTDPVDDSIKIPRLQSEITSTQWTKGKCFPTMGLHYWYNIRKDMSCDEFYPMFLLYNDGKLNAFGWAFNGDFNSSRLEHPPIAALSAFIDPVPDCLLTAVTLSTMHIYLTNNPALNQC
ncbi:uncharacterized protein LOC134716239 isoform X2 [Mytilus trossulus]|uniref:uncharacterized protein LOC134716239 isoform X2 n=1 Tax=Mytilus trossulus TaxID=6551 RepID=UPI003005F9DB